MLSEIFDYCTRTIEGDVFLNNRIGRNRKITRCIESNLGRYLGEFVPGENERMMNILSGSLL